MTANERTYTVAFRGPLACGRDEGYFDHRCTVLRSDWLTGALVWAAEKLRPGAASAYFEAPWFALTSAYPRAGQGGAAVRFLPVPPLFKTWLRGAVTKQAEGVRLASYQAFAAVLGGSVRSAKDLHFTYDGTAVALAGEGMPHELARTRRRPRIRVRGKRDEHATLEAFFHPAVAFEFRVRFGAGADPDFFAAATRLLADEGIGAGRSAGWGECAITGDQAAPLPEFAGANAALSLSLLAIDPEDADTVGDEAHFLPDGRHGGKWPPVLRTTWVRARRTGAPLWIEGCLFPGREAGLAGRMMPLVPAAGEGEEVRHGIFRCGLGLTLAVPGKPVSAGTEVGGESEAAAGTAEVAA